MDELNMANDQPAAELPPEANTGEAVSAAADCRRRMLRQSRPPAARPEQHGTADADRKPVPAAGR